VPPSSPLDLLRGRLEAERLATLSFSRALDHIGLDPKKLDWANLRALHERDADAAELLYGIDRGHISRSNAHRYRPEADAIHESAAHLRARVRDALPDPFQKRLDAALPIAVSTLTRDDIYADIRDAP